MGPRGTGEVALQDGISQLLPASPGHLICLAGVRGPHLSHGQEKQRQPLTALQDCSRGQ